MRIYRFLIFSKIIVATLLCTNVLAPASAQGLSQKMHYPIWYQGRIHANTTNPSIGIAIDHCTYWARDCGLGQIANAICRQYGFTKAIRHETYRPGRTFVVGDRKVCNGPCDGYRWVECRP